MTTPDPHGTPWLGDEPTPLRPGWMQALTTALDQADELDRAPDEDDPDALG